MRSSVKRATSANDSTGAKRVTTPLLAGYGWMSIAVLIWASWLVLTASGRTTTLSVIDLAALRAVVPAALLAPLLWRQRRTIARLGLVKCLYLSAYGAPFTVCVGYGLGFAPVVHAGAMVPGLMPVFAAVFGGVLLGNHLTRRTHISVLLILLGAVVIIVNAPAPSGSGDVWVGHLLFLIGALCWASFAVTMERHSVPPYLAIAIVGAASTACLGPVWYVSDLSALNQATLPDILFQAMFQGIFSGLISLFAFGRALRVLGARATALSALTPGVATVLAIPVLGQVPDIVDILALFAVILGLRIGARKPIGSATRSEGSN